MMSCRHKKVLTQLEIEEQNVKEYISFSLLFFGRDINFILMFFYLDLLRFTQNSSFLLLKKTKANCNVIVLGSQIIFLLAKSLD